MLRQAAQNAQQPEARGYSCWTFVMIFFGIQIVTNIIGSLTQKPESLKSTNQHPLKPQGPFLTNAIPPKSTLDVLVKVFNSSTLLFESRQLMEYSIDSPSIDL